ncbi:hypothetical protein [Celeribacter naphthalenivorans]|uniref:hypothetical protein n=1 Tax=Celeribacter naphthalenivorans TaxID=1614694 RepID=UPI001CF9AB0C|nr:hypothetical protein [Celeribacter naphthalenivorans]
MKDWARQINVTPCDAIVAGGEIQIVHKVSDLFIQIAPLHGRSAPISLTHQELAELIDAGSFSIEYG